MQWPLKSSWIVPIVFFFLLNIIVGVEHPNTHSTMQFAWLTVHVFTTHSKLLTELAVIYLTVVSHILSLSSWSRKTQRQTLEGRELP